MTTTSTMRSSPLDLVLNSDKFEWMALQGSDDQGRWVYGFEDLPGGGDKDFEDFIVKIQVV